MGVEDGVLRHARLDATFFRQEAVVGHGYVVARTWTHVLDVQRHHLDAHRKMYIHDAPIKHSFSPRDTTFPAHLIRVGPGTVCLSVTSRRSIETAEGRDRAAWFEAQRLYPCLYYTMLQA